MDKIRTGFLTLTLSLLAFAQVWANDPVTFIKRSWDAEQKKVVETDTAITEYTELSGNFERKEDTLKANTWYVVKGTVSRLSVFAPPGASGNLVICDGATLKGQIAINEGSTLNIYGQEHNAGEIQAESVEMKTSTESLGGAATVDVTVSLAAIGGGWDGGNMGTLVIHGGSIIAHSEKPTNAEFVAGIGGGRNGNGGSVTIYGGSVKAYGGKDAAGIGSAEQLNGNKHGGSLTVYGGTVEAHGGKHGAGIGGGQDASGATVVIYGGTVMAYGGADAAGIGSGEKLTPGVSINGGSLTVYGGNVFADGTDWGAGIGGGEDANGANVEIYGGTVTVWAGADAGKRNGSAIGCAKCDGNYGTLHINGDMRVYAGNDANNPQLFTYDQRVSASRWRPYARIVPCEGHEYTYTANESEHTGICKHCGHSETAAHYPEGPCICGYNGSESFLTVSFAKPVTQDGVPQYGNNGYVVYAATSVHALRGQPMLLPDCDVKVNGYRFKGWGEGEDWSLIVSSAELHAAGSEYTPTDNTTLAAHYEQISVITVAEPASSNPNGSYTTYKDTIAWNEDYVFPNASSPEGYTFVGWYIGSIEDLIDDGYSLKPEIQNPTLYQVDDVLTNVISDKEIVAVYIKTKFGAVTIAADRSSATIDGSYKEDDETEISSGITVQSVVFDRTFVPQKYSTIMLPFSIDMNKVSGAKFYGFAQMDYDQETGKWSAGASEIAQSETLVANTPYLVVTEGTSISFTGPVTLNTTGGGDGETVRDNWAFCGTYQYLVFGDVPEILGSAYGFVAKDTVLSGKSFSAGQFVKAGPRAYIQPMRAYLVYNGGKGGAKSVGGYGASFDVLPETIELKIMDAQGKVTETATLDTRTGEIKRDRWFDLQGRQLKGKPSIKGKYLHNGRVEVVK